MPDRLDKALAYATKKKRKPKPPAPPITAPHLEQLATVSVLFVQLEIARNLLEDVLRASRRHGLEQTASHVAASLSCATRAFELLRKGGA